MSEIKYLFDYLIEDDIVWIEKWFNYLILIVEFVGEILGVDKNELESVFFFQDNKELCLIVEVGIFLNDLVDFIFNEMLEFFECVEFFKLILLFGVVLEFVVGDGVIVEIVIQYNYNNKQIVEDVKKIIEYVRCKNVKIQFFIG